ncbi:hypothetical protein FHU38_004948 [Saccharomonospora amisosensis]|uniref:Uncharacterized protein n=1 Tax=Saccharomonospora amisosensis TaxID=1128677 RepID=A0A7X5ZT37_9PSEU|nr:hypothetical protein [Saccharomonospora amisosensis]NIJ14547.1 hypothetical protein [Saccharomonospora amisosensis]
MGLLNSQFGVTANHRMAGVDSSAFIIVGIVGVPAVSSLMRRSGLSYGDE